MSGYGYYCDEPGWHQPETCPAVEVLPTGNFRLRTLAHPTALVDGRVRHDLTITYPAYTESMATSTTGWVS